LANFSQTEQLSIFKKREEYALYIVTLLYPWSDMHPLPQNNNISWWDFYVTLIEENKFSLFSLNILINIQAFYDNFIEENTDDSVNEIVQKMYLDYKNNNLVDNFSTEDVLDLLNPQKDLVYLVNRKENIDSKTTENLENLNFEFHRQQILPPLVKQIDLLIMDEDDISETTKVSIDFQETSVSDYIFHAFNNTRMFQNQESTISITESSPPGIKEHSDNWNLSEEQYCCFFFFTLFFSNIF